MPSEQIYHQVRAIIISGSLGTGEKLPSVRQLARDLHVAAGTVAKAYKLLEQEGLVITRAGGGTRVSSAVSAPPTVVVQAARALAALASAHGVSLDETLSALQASWIDGGANGSPRAAPPEADGVSAE
nr:GntR family transcriptional regulator [Leifsonia psychrotolerans]